MEKKGIRIEKPAVDEFYPIPLKGRSLAQLSLFYMALLVVTYFFAVGTYYLIHLSR